jgi:uncharacterized membrane protein
VQINQSDARPRQFNRTRPRLATSWPRPFRAFAAARIVQRRFETQHMPSFKRISVSVHRRRSRWEGPGVKAASYRAWMGALDFLAVFSLTRRVGLALGFSLLSLLYRTIGRSLHERVWLYVVSNSRP